jgi:Lamin Tail Domain/Secretion system C-terminal sorting domain
MKTFTRRFLFLFAFALAAFNTSAQLVINEVDYDQPSTDSSEFIELYNSSANAIDLADYTLLLYNGNATGYPVYDSIIFTTFSLAPGAYYVICGSTTGLVSPCDTSLGTSIGGGAIQNGGSTATPSCDAIALRHNASGNIVDAVSYEGNCSAPYIEGNGIPDTLSDNGITAGVSISRYPDGHDTQDNAADFFLVCSTPGATNCQPTATLDRSKLGKTVAVYPNPATSFVTVESNSSKSVSVSLRNILGKEVKHYSSQRNKLTIDINGLEEGVYLLFIRTDGGESTQRLIVRK